MASLASEFTKGLWRDVAPFRLVLGLCPSLAVTNSAINGLSMGLATFFVLISSTFIVSLIRRLVSSQVRIAAYMIIIATLVTVTDLFVAAYFPPISKSLGPYIPLIICNCLILGRVEAFAQKNPIVPTIADSLGTGLGFTISLVIMGSIRELLGFGSIFKANILGGLVEPWIVMILPAGAFIVFGFLTALVNYISSRTEAQ